MRLLAVLLALRPATLAIADNVIGYVVESGSTYTASCDDAYGFTSLSDTVPACTNTFHGSQSTYTLLYFFSCAGSTLVKASVEGTKGNVATSTLATYKCLGECSTVKIYNAYPSATATPSPTYELAMCLSTDDMYTTDTYVAGVDGHLPTDVQALYRFPSSVAITSATTSGSSSTSTSTPAGGGSSSNKVPVIVGSVVGSLAAIAFIVALILFRRRLFRKKAARTPPGPSDSGEAEPRLAELDPEDSHKLPRQEMADSSPIEIDNVILKPPELDSSQAFQIHEVPGAPPRGVYELSA